MFLYLQVLLGLVLPIVLAAVAKSAVQQEDQTAEASQTSSKTVVQQRLDLFGNHDLVDHHDHHVHEEHHHHHEEHDPGYWKKKLIWKEGWKKIWSPGKKQIWKPAWKKIHKVRSDLHKINGRRLSAQWKIEFAQ